MKRRAQIKFYSKLSDNKIKIGMFARDAIRMDDFLSMLTIDVGAGTVNFMDWTDRYNEEHDLFIKGGIYNKTEYLHYIQYGKNPSNPYNKFVTPFFIWDILTDDGKRFFMNLYKEDIAQLLHEKECEAEEKRRELVEINRVITSVKTDIAEFGE